MPDSASAMRVPRPILAGLAALAGWFVLDALLFRTPVYSDWIEPNSSTGQFELTLRREQEFQLKATDNVIVTLGDSRFGYLPRQANELTRFSGYVFRSAGVAGSDPRGWYYMLRDLDPTAQRYRAVVLGFPHFYDEEDEFQPDTDLRSLHYAIARLRLADVIPFAFSFPGWRGRWEALRGSLFKGFVYQRDIHEFLSHPIKRIKFVQLMRGGYETWTYNYEEEARSMAGLRIDWSTMEATLPPALDASQIESAKNELVHGTAPQTGRLAAFRRLWLGRIVDRYRNSRTKVIFVSLARGPIPRPESLAQKQSSVMRELAATHPNVLLADEHAFESLEHPELYKDGVHLNREGARRFAPLLVKEVSRLLGTPNAL
jgi:hypothetical protein